MINTRLLSPNRTIRMTVVAFLTAAFLSPLSYALPDDHKQPMRVKSGSFKFSKQTGESIYEGNVEFRQGSIKLDADKVIVYAVDGVVTQMFAFGRPAKFDQTLEPGNDLHAEGERIEYRLAEGQIVLDGQALMINGVNRISGAHIACSTDGSTCESDGGDGLVEMIISPDELSSQ